jgi:Flp pilus assembly pilin Flp
VSAARIFVRLHEHVIRFARGQTMAEYGLILPAIEIVVFAVYQMMGQNIGSLLVESTP